LGDNAKEGAATGRSPRKLQDLGSEEQPGMGLSEAIDLVNLVGVPGHVGEGTS
jgi:hypothetical protein